MSGPGQPVPDELLLAGLIEANRDHQPGPAGPAISDHPDDHVEWLHAALSAVLPAHEAMVWEHIAAEVSIQAGGDELMKWWEAVIEHRVRAKVAEGLSKAAAGYRRSAKRGGVLQYEMERRATILEFHAERIARGTS